MRRRSSQERARSVSRLPFAEPPIPTKHTHTHTYEQKIPGNNISANLFVRITYLKGDDANQDAEDEKDERDDEPDHTPHCLKFV